MTIHSFRSGTTEINGVQIDRVLRVSTVHMPDLNEDLSHWHWGTDERFGFTWFLAYEEDMSDGEHIMPAWLLAICLKARDVYGCNWIALDPDAEKIPGLQVYHHS